MVQIFANPIHRLHIDQPHEIKSKTIDVIFLGPIPDRLPNEMTDHRTLRCDLVTAARTIGPGTIGPGTVIIVRNRLLKGGFITLIGVVIHHIHNHADACLMKCLNHLLHLTNPYFAMIRICRIGALRHIIILGIIAPVIKIFLPPGLVYCVEVEAGHQMHVGDS